MSNPPETKTDRSLKMDRSLMFLDSSVLLFGSAGASRIWRFSSLTFLKGPYSSPKLKEREKNFRPQKKIFRWSYLPIEYVGPRQPQMLVQETAAWSHSCGRYLWGHTRHPDKTRVEFVGISHTTMPADCSYIHHPFQLHISSSKSSSFWWVLQDQEVVLLEEGHIHSAGTT